MKGRRGSAVVVAVVAMLATMLGGAEAAVQVSPRVAVSTPGHGLGEFAAARSPVDPNHLIVGGMDWDDAGGSISCATFISRDGGLSWTPGGSIDGLDESFARGDPWVTIDTAGRAHLQCMLIDGEPVAYAVGSVDGTTGRPTVKQMHARSDDGGTSWGPARRIPPKDPLNQVDKEALYASRAGVLYACINDYPRGEGGDALVVSRSFDGGDTWTVPKSLDEVIGIDSPAGSGFGNCNGFTEGPDGTVYMTWVGNFPAEPLTRWGVVFTRDGGATWRSTTVGALVYSTLPAPANTAEALLLNPFPSMPSIAADPVTGDVFAAMQRHDGNGFRAELFRSTDGGVSFSAVALPAIPSVCAGCHQMRPAIVVDAAGNLGMQVMVTGKDFGLSREAWFLITPDGGASWLDPIQLSSTGAAQSYLDPRNWDSVATQPITNRLSQYAENPETAGTKLGWEAVARAQRTDHIRWGGDYWNITTSSRGFVALWEDHFENGKHQLWSRIVKVL